MKSYALMLLVLCAGGCASAPSAPATPSAPLQVPPADGRAGETPEWWFLSGAAARSSAGPTPTRRATSSSSSVTAWGVATVSAARIFAGQQQGQPGEEHLLAFEAFDHTALVKTYNTDQQTPDSAGTMTAMMSGVKTRAGVIGVDSEAPRAACADSHGTEVPSLMALAQRAGMGTGIVTNTRITHATPAAVFAHGPERGWESDAQLSPTARAQGCSDLARQLVESDVGSRLDVVMGGGRLMFLPAGQSDPEYPQRRGLRRDGRDLVEEWRDRHPAGRWAWNQEQFEALDLSAPGPILALFDPDHMKFEHDRPRDRAGEPSLAEMTAAAITRLQHAPGGYVLMVEGGRIDHAHHFGNAFRALSDTVAFSDAVAVADAMTDARETLILVTADHSHVLSFAGYPRRGNPILGKVEVGSRSGATRLALDGTLQPYTTLSYANGPGYAGASASQPEGPKRFLHAGSNFEASRGGRPDLSGVDTTDPDYLQEAMVPLGSETHGGEDVPLYARGPGASAARGVLEQHVLFHIMVQATPALRGLLCAAGACENGVPARLLRPGELPD